MRYILAAFFSILFLTKTIAQVITTNTNPVSMEHNVLFDAKNRYTVSQSGNADLDLDKLFDGKFSPSTTETAPSYSDPTVILIENIPYGHTQQGAWIGWSSRVWYPTKFKIEAYDTYYGRGWTPMADYSSTSYNSKSFFVKMIGGAYTKLRFTFYESSVGDAGRFQISELFYIHPELVAPYNGLFGSAKSSWDIQDDNLFYNNGKVGIGTTNPTAYLTTYLSESGKALSLLGVNKDIELHMGHGTGISFGFFWRYVGSRSGNLNDLELWSQNMASDDRLVYQVHQNGNIKFMQNVGVGCEAGINGYSFAVKGTIGCGELIVDEVSDWPDYVFDDDYKLISLDELKNFIQSNNHLPDMPTADDVKKEGISIGEMNKKLLQKVEELTLYTLEQQEVIEELKMKMELQNKRIKTLESQNESKGN